MTANDILIDGYGRIAEEVHAVLEGVNEEQLAWRPTETANSIAWLVWHLTRIQDDHISELRQTEQLWMRGWADRFGAPFPIKATGYGQTSEEVGALQATPDILLGYFDAVHTQTIDFLRNLQPDEYEKIVDTSWDPPVTLGVRLVSVLADCLQHVGQAAYVRGIIPQSDK